jgi:hypothetical protein
LHSTIPATKVGELASRLQSYLADHPDCAEVEVGVRPFTHNSRVLGFGLWDHNSTTDSPRPWIEFSDIEIRLHDGPESAPDSRWMLGPYHRNRRDFVGGRLAAFGMFFTHEDGRLVKIESTDIEQAWYGNILFCPLKRSFCLPILTVVVPMNGAAAYAYFLRVRVEDGVITNESLREMQQAAKGQNQRIRDNESRRVREQIGPSLQELDQLEGWPDDWQEQLRDLLPGGNRKTWDVVEIGIGGPLLYSLETASDIASAFNAFGLVLQMKEATQ